MGVKDYFAKKLLEKQLKNVPESQRGTIMKLVEKNPEIFEKIANEIKEKKNAGQDETMATFSVMKKYEPKLRELAKNI